MLFSGKKNTIKRPEVTVIEIRNIQIIIQKVKNKYMYMSYYNTFRRFERRQEFPAQASAYCYVLNEHKTGTGDSRSPNIVNMQKQDFVMIID